MNRAWVYAIKAFSITKQPRYKDAARVLQCGAAEKDGKANRVFVRASVQRKCAHQRTYN